jgi:hypothetical protein
MPTRFDPPYDFSSELGTEHGTHLDATFDDLKVTSDSIINDLALIQRDDGVLGNQTVHPDALTTATRALLAAGTGIPRGEWASSTNYALKDVISRGASLSYMAAAAHTSGANFSVDLANGLWILLQNSLAAADAATVTFTPAAGISAVTVQGALLELDSEKALVAGSDAQPFAVSASTSQQYAARVGQIQQNSLRYATAGGTADALTATVASSLTALTDGMEFIIKASAANATTTPTLNLTLGATATGVKTIVRATSGGALAAGSIANSRHYMHLIYDATNGVWCLVNTAA